MCVGVCVREERVFGECRNEVVGKTEMGQNRCGGTSQVLSSGGGGRAAGELTGRACSIGMARKMGVDPDSTG